MAVRAVLFDLDDTLLEEEAPLMAAYRAACGEVGERYGIAVDTLIARSREAGRAAWAQAPAIGYLRAVDAGSSDLLSSDYDAGAPHQEAMADWLTAYRQAFFRNGLAAFGIRDDNLADACLARFQFNRHRHHRLYPETHDVLEALHGRFPLVLVTNGPGPHQRAKMQASGLDRYFKDLVISGEVGVSKPDARMFRAALEAAGTNAAEAVMVGNNLERDIGGAQAHGIRGVWVNRDGGLAAGVKPFAEIGDLRELFPLVGDAT